MPMPSLFDDPQELFTFCSVLHDNGNSDEAIALMRQGLEERGSDPEMVATAHMFLAHNVHFYHRQMLADIPRNDAYDAMLKRQAPGRRILDIGTGTGLLAMMAVRAGAEHVYACEINPHKADLAKTIIAQNGMEEKITLFCANSLDLDRERDLDGGVDAVMSELYTADIIGESLIQTHVHAQNELTLPGAIFLPPKVQIMGALAECDLGDPIGDVAGFDLSLIEQRLNYYALIEPYNALRYQRGPAHPLCDLNFLPDTPIKDRDRTITPLQSNGGKVTGVLYWMRIHFGADILYENMPGGARELHWAVRFEPFNEPRETAPGEPVEVGCAHNSNKVIIWDASAAK